MKPIQFPIAVCLWACLVAFVLYHNWGWWRDSWEGFWLSLLVPLFLGGMLLGVTFLALCGLAYGSARWLGDEQECIWKQSWHAQMVALRNSDGVNGRIVGSVFVMAGYVESSEVYYYYTSDRADEYRPHKWRQDDDTFIREEDRKDAEVFQYETAFAKPSAYWFALPNDRIKMEFRIPRGTLVHSYAIK